MNIFEFLKFLFFTKVYQSRFLLAAYKCWKVVLRIYTNTTELYRICSSAAIEAGIVHNLPQNDTSDMNDKNDTNDDAFGSTDQDDDTADGDKIPLLTRQRTISPSWRDNIDAVDVSIPLEAIYRVGRNN